MGILNIFKAMLQTQGKPPFEVEEEKISLEFGRKQVRVKSLGEDMALEKCLKAAGKLKNLKISRFYLVSEHPWGLHFAPTLEKALDWFAGRKVPGDGYLSISWGKNITYVCGFCNKEKTEPLYVTKVKKVILSGDSPFQYEIEGWRVSEVETKGMGKGIPAKISGLKTIPIIKWYSGKNGHICQLCADKFRANGQEDRITDYAIF